MQNTDYSFEIRLIAADELNEMTLLMKKIVKLDDEHASLQCILFSPFEAFVEAI